MSDMDTEAKAAGAAPVLGGITPYLAVDGAVRAVEFYGRAMGAEVAALVPPDAQGRTMHAHLHINGGSLMLSDFFPEQGHAVVAPQGYTLTLELDEVDAWWTRAVAAGCTVVMPLADQFWGKRYGQLRDPFGVLWAFSGKEGSGKGR